MPGLGYIAVVTIGQQDLPVFIGIVAAAAIVVANIGVDVLLQN